MTAEQTESPTRSRSQHQRRRRIVQAAAALASRGGVEAMQMRTVAERAGVALGTLYRYFPSKMDLVVAVVSEELDMLEKSMQRRPPASTSRRLKNQDHACPRPLATFPSRVARTRR